VDTGDPSTPGPVRAPALTRLRYLLALALTVALGLLSRLFPLGWSPWDKSLGDVLYAVAAYLALSLLAPRWRVTWRAALALGWCLAVEALQTTGVPARYAHLLAVRWLIGTAFAWHDVACYAVGVAFVAAADRAGSTSPPAPARLE
jgi:hypothetical protein